MVVPVSFCSPGAISLNGITSDVFVVRLLRGTFFNVTTPNADKNVVSSKKGNKILKSVVVFIGILRKE